MTMRLLAIETSCDETAAAVLDEDGRVLSNAVASQVAIHAPYGGVVPELASRHHTENICPVIAQAMRDAQSDFKELDVIAVTYGPGLIGALLVGVQAAKAIAFALGKPLVPVHHIAGHLEAPWLYAATEVNRPAADIPLPGLALVVSGGHSSLFAVRARGRYRLLGRTRDDAAGEAFDKVAKLLGLGYPGGPVIDRLARGANDHAIDFTIAKIKDGRPDFSFSGIKTAVLYYVRKHGIAPVANGGAAPDEVRDLVASFQRAVVSALIARFAQTAASERPRSLLLTGGVAANSVLRREAQALADRIGLPLFVPPLEWTTDNAAMIGAAGWTAYRQGVRAGWDLNAEASLPLGITEA
ncbi:MAG: tRNA (adenosine(37)-N6)-threonylcarbamoyltransferase complex transferase subunit TsaD [Vicinamibacteria bacterium]|jgi:N6-L-threonylcarbamoyladenine synthase|nr:tRNA (adenosine(37)-N6)-threonylcarbamoyltransferase complex transferase subunit TsaD [Vicinamibacteria bacterium]